MSKIEFTFEIVWLVLAMLYPLPSPTDGDGSANTVPHLAECKAGIEMIFHV